MLLEKQETMEQMKKLEISEAYLRSKVQLMVAETDQLKVIIKNSDLTLQEKNIKYGRIAHAFKDLDQENDDLNNKNCHLERKIYNLKEEIHKSQTENKKKDKQMFTQEVVLFFVVVYCLSIICFVCATTKERPDSRINIQNKIDDSQLKSTKCFYDTLNTPKCAQNENKNLRNINNNILNTLSAARNENKNLHSKNNKLLKGLAGAKNENLKYENTENALSFVGIVFLLIIFLLVFLGTNVIFMFSVVYALYLIGLRLKTFLSRAFM